MFPVERKSTKHIERIALLVILFGLIARASFLEYYDLVDPTESRYALIAEKMVRTGEWIVPTLPMPAGEVPYLGKPPLHFWLTALSFTAFGIDEWSARLPSYLATVGLLLSLYLFCRRHLFGTTPAVACLLYLSSALGFFLAGASVTDVTLTAFVTMGTVALYHAVQRTETEKGAYQNAMLATLCGALGFLTKGPISVVLIWLPIVLWSGIRRDFSWRRDFPWARSVLLFLALVAPWFIVSELRNPGFIRYFIWNENIGRYLFRDYGDRYGSGHVHPYGSAWWMLAAAFLPWTPVLGVALFRQRLTGLKALFHRGSPHLFVACWAVSAPLFFTFVRQLHAMYLLPALAPLSVLTATLLTRKLYLGWSRRFFRREIPLLLYISLGATALIAGGALLWDAPSLTFGVVLFVSGAVFFLLAKSEQHTTALYLSKLSAAVIGTYLLAIVAATPFLNINNSAQTALHRIALLTDCQHPSEEHRIAIASDNTFSHYWAADAGAEEIPEKVRLSYVDPAKAATTSACSFLYKAKSLELVPKAIRDNFHLLEQSGQWYLFAKK